MNRKEFFIDVPWGRIAVVTYNSEDLPLVILCHGRSDSADTFMPLIKLLPPTYHYVTFDIPGCGYSDKMSPGSVLIMFTFLPALKVVADKFGDRKFIFIGHSGGVELGMLYNVITDGSRITKLVDIDFFCPPPLKTHYLKTYEISRLLGETLTFKQYLNKYYVEFYEPNNYRKFNASLDTAPSYTMEQAIGMLEKSRNLSPQNAEIALKRNLRPDPKNSGKFKLVWDQRFKATPRSPLTIGFWMKLRELNPVPTLALVTTTMSEYLEKLSGIDLSKAIQQILPYFKMVKFESYHDVHLIMPENLAPHIIEFMELDLSAVKPKKFSKM